MFRIADGRAAWLRRPARPRSLDRVPDQRRGPRPRVPARPRHRHHLAARRPGPASGWTPASRAGSVIGPAWDSLLAKLIVTGATRAQALQRAARALAEFEVGGLATALPFHRAVVTDPAFAPELHGQPGPFTVHTRWIETEFRNQIPPWAPDGTEAGDGEEDGARQTDRRRGRRQAAARSPCPPPSPPAPPPPERRLRPGRAANAPARTSGGNATGATLTAPMQGTVIKVAVEDGQQVKTGDLILVLEAMKMEQPVNAHKAGTVANLTAQPGASLTSGAAICEITD